MLTGIVIYSLIGVYLGVSTILDGEDLEHALVVTTLWPIAVLASL